MTYRDLKERLGKYGKVKNVRMFLNNRTGKFEGNVLVSFDEDVKTSEVMQALKDDPEIDFVFQTAD